MYEFQYVQDRLGYVGGKETACVLNYLTINNLLDFRIFVK